MGNLAKPEKELREYAARFLEEHPETHRGRASGEHAPPLTFRISPPLVVDAEFHGLLPPHEDYEYAGLERSIVEEGCHNPIVAWNNIILDGHARYEICVKHGIDYEVFDKELAGRTEAKLYILDQQLNRKNLSFHEQILLCEKLDQLQNSIATARREGSNHGEK
jgi:ParB-like chromosome segregation protein Spo0J